MPCSVLEYDDDDENNDRDADGMTPDGGWRPRGQPLGLKNKPKLPGGRGWRWVERERGMRGWIDIEIVNSWVVEIIVRSKSIFLFANIGLLWWET